MKHSTIILLAVFPLLLGCAKDKDAVTSRTCTITAGFESRTTKVSLAPADNSLNLISRWLEGDMIQSFFFNDNKISTTGENAVRNISDDGRQCIITFGVPEDYLSAGYRTFLVTEDCAPMVSDGKLHVCASISRSTFKDFKAPVYFETNVCGNNTSAVFRHYLAYEVLHVSNVTNQDIEFSLTGYEASSIWFRSKGAVCLNDMSFVTDSRAARTPVTESPTIKVGPMTTECIISSYVPNGQKINNAVLVARINGQIVKTANAKSSDVIVETSNAYHLYVDWDGEKLLFSDGPGSSQITGGGSGYGPNPGGITGGGTGYGGGGNNGDINGTGTGYTGGNTGGGINGTGTGYGN